jgi:hypothetical protein
MSVHVQSQVWLNKLDAISLQKTFFEDISENIDIFIITVLNELKNAKTITMREENLKLFGEELLQSKKEIAQRELLNHFSKDESSAHLQLLLFEIILTLEEFLSVEEALGTPF